MDRKVILLAIISCINAIHLNTDLLPPDLPPANVANIFHDSGITFVSPSNQLEISSSVVAPTLPVTHAFGFVSNNRNGPQELVRTHSSQLVADGLHSSVSALSSPNGIHSNNNGQITSHRHGHSPQVSYDAHISVQSPLADVVQARFVENEHHAVHEINSRTQHFEYKVPFSRTVPQHGHNFDHHEHHHGQFNQRNTIAKHSTYGVPSGFPSKTPSQIPSQVPSDTPTFIPSHVSSSPPSQIPSQIPSETPTFIPSHVSSSAPSQLPSRIPSETPTFIPSHISSSAPSQIPSQIASDTPTFIPSNAPSQDEINEPTFIPTQEEIDALPVFQNDKFLSPFARHAKTPVTHSNIELPSQTTESIFDTSFHSNSPTTRTRVNTFNPSVHSTTSTRENIIGGNNQYANRFSLPDGTKVSEQGKLISPKVGWENVISKTGEYEYVSPEGIPVKVKWIADHEGFRILN